jgi:hypothetical protein
VAYAEEKGEYDDVAYQKALISCSQCRQEFQGPVRVALKRAQWLHFAGRAETDRPRQVALGNLGMALTALNRLDEALVVHEDLVATTRRMYGPDGELNIYAEEVFATTLRRQGGNTNISRALQILSRVYAWKANHFGRDDDVTLDTALQLATTQRNAGQLPEAVLLLRGTIAAQRRVSGDEHFRTMQCKWVLVDVLVRQNELDEAHEIHSALLPMARRVLGPQHFLTRSLQRPDFLDPSSCIRA